LIRYRSVRAKRRAPAALNAAAASSANSGSGLAVRGRCRRPREPELCVPLAGSLPGVEPAVPAAPDPLVPAVPLCAAPERVRAPPLPAVALPVEPDAPVPFIDPLPADPPVRVPVAPLPVVA
jgi:hypothetical protein